MPRQPPFRKPGSVAPAQVRESRRRFRRGLTGWWGYASFVAGQAGEAILPPFMIQRLRVRRLHEPEDEQRIHLCRLPPQKLHDAGIVVPTIDRPDLHRHALCLRTQHQPVREIHRAFFLQSRPGQRHPKAGDFPRQWQGAGGVPAASRQIRGTRRRPASLSAPRRRGGSTRPWRPSRPRPPGAPRSSSFLYGFCAPGS